MADREYGFRTRAIHAGNIPDAVTGARALPIYQSSAFVFDLFAPGEPHRRGIRGAHREP
jgi:O-acetylhomoserine/O-acetylserine sulfhydrylase-like pyridoxal-dependent enzyme